MSERQALLAILYGLCLLECLFWIRRGSLAFRRSFSGKWHRTEPVEALGNDAGALGVGPLLPTFGSVHLCGFWPFAVSSTHLIGFQVECLPPGVRTSTTNRVVEWTGVGRIETDQTWVCVDGARFCKAASVTDATAHVAFFQKLASATETQRPTLIRDQIRLRTDRGLLRRQMEALNESVAGLRTAIRIFGFCVLVVAPVVVWRLGWFPAIWPLLGGWLLGSAMVTSWFLRIHRRFFPLEGDERFRLGALGWLAPAVTLRLLEALEKPLLSGFHPVAGILEILGSDRDQVRPLLSAIWRDLNFPRLPDAPGPDVAVVAAVEWFRNEMRGAVGELLARDGWIPAEFLEKPKPSEASHAKCCPRCETQFTEVAERCAQCGGIPLIKLR